MLLIGPDPRWDALELALWMACGVEHIFQVIVPGNPKSKNRYPVTSKGARYPASKKDERYIGGFMRSDYREKPIDVPLAVATRFYRGTERKFDDDNALKLLGDAGNGILWKDDSLIRRRTSGIQLDREHPRTEIRFGRITV